MAETSRDGNATPDGGIRFVRTDEIATSGELAERFDMPISEMETSPGPHQVCAGAYVIDQKGDDGAVTHWRF